MKRIYTTLVLALLLNVSFSQSTYYVNDNSTSNDAFTSGTGSDTNPGTAALPFATIQHAADVATAGSIIYIDAGIYFEQVTLSKGLSLFGVNSGVTIVWKPAVTNPPPGPFTEKGTIQSAQNIGDVHIRDMSITGDGSIGLTPIILQTGGSVKNCRLIGGSQGIFFRVDPAVKTALIENNYINIDYIGINCQGSGLTATLINNTIDLTNPFFAAGVFAGLDFGPLVRFTAFGNVINNYNAQGFLANSYNTNITQNSILGTGQHAIEQSTNSLAFATCNWFGTTNAATIASKVSGLFSYTPYLTNGTNTNTTYGNYSFVPVAGACGEGVNNFYVNDNSRINDVFTTAVGSNANSGTSTAPFATLSYAISVAPANSVIHVDAGTYVEQVIIDRGIVINGAGRELTSFIKPASALVPAPGPFTEIGLIETTQGIGDVHIRNISVNSVDGSSQNIIIQSGGSVKNCKLLNGGQGVFFRLASGTRSANVEFNTIQPNGIGINCQGAGLTTTIVNNTISKVGGYYSGIFAGLDFGPLPQLTITNNAISDYFGTGMVVNSNGSNITNNSILGTGNRAIEQGSGNRLNATCNWFGSVDPNIFVPKIYGNINYSPWLTSGTDNDAIALGFQPLPGVCNVRQNKFYVNDNSLTGGVFTTAVGDDNNGGVPAAPLLTIGAALTKASTGDSIFVDAGTYNLAAQFNINKGITILGTNYSISPNDGTNKYLPNAARNAESNFTGSNFNIAADNVVIKGLKFSPASGAITSSNENSHITLEKNSFTVITTGNAVLLQGVSLSPIVKFDVNISDNRFNRTDNFAGNSILIGNVKSILVDNNVFIESGAATNVGTGLRGFGGFGIESSVVSNNYMKKLGLGIAPFSLKDVTMVNNKFDSCSQGIFISPSGPVSSNVGINDNTFTNLRVGRSIMVRGGSGGTALSNLTVSGNTINQEVNGINGIVGMIQLEFIATNTYGNVYVQNNKINISGDYAFAFSPSQCGIILTGKHSNTTVSGNELNFSAINVVRGAGTFLPPFPTGIFINTDGGAANGIIPPGAILNITNNKINGFKGSIGLYDPSAAGVNTNFGYGYLAAGVQVNIHDNSFVNDSMSIDNGANSQNINATCNFYNTNIPEVIITKISPETGDYLPWLINGTDNEPLTTGFQPVPGSCTGRVNKWYVNDAITAGDVFTTKAGDDVNGYGLSTSPFATITRALTEAQAGDSIFVDAGTYVLSADLTINKAVTILGTNYLLSPNDANDKRILNAVRNAESIVSNATLIIGSNDISIQGMVLDPGAAAIAVFFSNSNYNNISLAKNRIKMNSTSPSIRFEGQGTNTIAVSALVNSGFTINDNRFEKYDVNHSFSINISRLKNVTVTNNAFVVGGSTLRNYTAIVMGNAGVIDAITFSANTIDRALNAINGSRIGNAVLNGNKIYNTNNAINSTNGIPESSNVEFSNNLLDGSAGIFPFVFYTRNGGSTGGSSSQFKTENNTITGTAVAGTTTLLGSYNIGFSNTVLSPSLIIRNNIFNYAGDLSTVEGQFLRPIAIKGKLANATVDHNELTLSGINLQPKNPASVLPVCPAISLYTDNGSTSGIPAGAVINILNNKVHGFKYSFVVFDPVNGSDPYTGFGNLGPNISVNVHENSFTADSMSINNGSVGYPIDASCNWYGSSAVQNLVGKFSTDLDNIYVPYLSNGTDNDAATGFQPVPGSCNGQPLQARLDGYTNVTCNGANNGTASVTVFNGVAPYVFAWTKDGDPLFSSNIEDPTNFGPGTYHLIITDALGTNLILDENEDITTIDVTITEPPLLTASTGGSNVSCFGGANGSASVTAGGGTLPYTFLWSNSSTNASITNLSAGIYSVTVTDGNGCTKSASYEVTQPAILTATGSGTNVSCFGGSNGTATVTVGGGTLPYNYAWSNGATTQSISGLTAGTYTVTVTDGNGCTKSASYEVTQPAVLTATGSGTNVSCFGGSNGTATVTVGGGTLPNTYAWSNGGTTQSISGLAIGTYNITVTDGNGCTKSASYQVTQPALLTAVASGTSTSCANTATVVASGGTLPYSYAWSNGATTQSITSIPAGTYTVIVTDNKGCTASSSVTVTANQAFNPSASVTNVSCFGTSTGSITITNVNAVSPFQFSLNGVNFSAPAPLPFTFSGLAAGTYTITVKDANGCTGFVTKTITEPALLVVTQGSVQSTCAGQSTGSITVNMTGGSGSLSYSWTGPGGYTSTQKNISGLATGNYSLTVTDANGCSKNLNVNVPVYPVINLSASITNVLCYGGTNGSIDLTVTGGTGSGFTYLWNSGATTQDRFNLPTGSNYKITITDIGSGCAITQTYAVTQPFSALSVTVSNQNIVDVTGCNSLGSFTAQGLGGTVYPNPDPYRYSINGVNYQTSPVFNNLAAGNYTVTIKDANGCTATKTISIGDTGSDEYESSPYNTGNANNNNKGKAAPISLGTSVSARLGVVNDVDYYKLGASNIWSGNYTISVVQPSPAVTVDLVQSNGTTVQTPSSSSGNNKYYNNLSGTFYVRVSGTNSLNCYQLTVSNGIITKSSGISVQQEVTKAPVKDGLFDVKVLGNPSSTGFIMNVITSSEEKISMRVFDAQGRLIEQRQSLQPFETLRVGERYINGVYLAEIIQGKNTKTIRLVKM